MIFVTFLVIVSVHAMSNKKLLEAKIYLKKGRNNFIIINIFQIVLS